MPGRENRRSSRAVRTYTTLLFAAIHSYLRMAAVLRLCSRAPDIRWAARPHGCWDRSTILFCLEHMYAIKHLQADKGTWYWSVNFSRNGQHHYRRFYEPKYGGSDAALQAAIAWRDEKLAEAKVLGVLEFCQKKRSNNSSGVPGVHFLTPAAQPEGIWQARLKLADGTNTTKTFSVQKHGKRKAFKLAVAARREMLQRAKDRPYVYDPLAKKFAARQSKAAI